jgi:nitroreductase/NAD-dependent dihydropyrimidine dehydrogenase PreA subunit
MASFLSIDETSCTLCGDCVAACPVGSITMNAGTIKVQEDAASRCVLCGHCISACPEHALRHNQLNAEECLPLDVAWRSSPGVVEQLIKGRRSIRRYRPEAVEKSVLESVLDIVRYAPTGMNTQTVEWLVIYQREEVRKLAASVIEWMRELAARNELVGGRYHVGPLVAAWDAGYDPILRGCPHLFIAHGHESDLVGQTSGIIALTTTELAALPFGLGTCWAGFLHLAAKWSPQVHAALGLPPKHVMQGGLMIGYPKETYHAIPPRKPLQIQWR